MMMNDDGDQNGHGVTMIMIAVVVVFVVPVRSGDG